MSTRKLYWDDVLATRFETSGAAPSSFEGRPSVVLPETLFYPEGGGQLGDTGTLRAGSTELRVVDTQVDDAGVIHHLLEAPLEAPPAGAVEGRVDEARRRDHMAQHTAQHVLSHALVDEARALTVSARLGATSCTLDVDRAGISDAEIARAEDVVNAVVRADVAVRTLFPTPEELAAMKLRRTPKVQTGVRVVEVEGFDLTPCGGTHVTRSGQIGLIRVVGLERYKGKLRVTFHAAARALGDARAKEGALTALARDLSCGPLDVGAAVGKLRAELKERSDALARARGELSALVADALLTAHPPVPGSPTRLVVERKGDDVGFLRTLAGRLATRPDVVALCASEDGTTGERVVVLQRGAETTFDCGAWLKRAASAHGGRGGGRPERAEGRLPAAAPLDLGA